MKKHFPLLLMVLLFFSSCVFNPEKENFVEVDQDVTAPNVINRTLDLNSDTLFILYRTVLNFDFVSSKQPIIGIVFNYANVEKINDLGKGSFEIDPATLADGTYSLDMKLYTHSGNGSLADVTGNETFVFKKKWVLVVEKPTPPKLNITTSTTENGFLKISWDKFDKLNFVSYELRLQNKGINHSYSFLSSNKSCTSFIDSFYVGGKLNITLATRYVDTNGNTSTAFSNYEQDYPLALKFIEKTDSIILSWGKNPYRCKRFLSISGGNAQQIVGDTSYSIKSPGMGIPIKYCISFQPLNFPVYEHQQYYLYANYVKGVNMGCGFSNIAYHAKEKAYYVKHPMYVRKFSEFDFQQMASYDYSWDYYDDVSLAFSPEGKVVSSTILKNRIDLDVTDLKLLQNKPLHGNEVFPPYTRCFEWLNDSLFLIGYDSFFAIMDSNNKIISRSGILKDSGGKPNQCFGISANGKYLAYCGDLGLVVYENIDNQRLQLKYEDSKKYYNCVFDLTRPERLILNAPDDNVFWNCETSTNEGSIGPLVANPINIDPVTNYLLMISNSKAKIYIYDMVNQEILFETPFHGNTYQYKLLNNCIFSYAGYAYKITSNDE